MDRIGARIAAVACALLLVGAACSDDDAAGDRGALQAADGADGGTSPTTPEPADDTTATDAAETPATTDAGGDAPEPPAVELPVDPEVAAYCSSGPTATSQAVVAGKGAQQALDAAAVAAYGCDHRDTYAGLEVDGDRILVGFTADLEAHERALAELVQRPDLVELHLAPYTLAQLVAVQAEIPSVLEGPDNPMRTISVAGDAVAVALRADALDAAAALHARYGSAVAVQLGLTPWTAGGPGQGEPSCGPGPVGASLPGLVATVELAAPTVTAGADLAGDVVLRNDGTQPIRFASGEPAVAVVLDPDTGAAVAHYDGIIAGVGTGVDLAPGAEVRIPFLGGTAACAADAYALAPGSYDVVVEVDAIAWQPGDAEVDGDHVLAGPTPLTVVAAE